MSPVRLTKTVRANSNGFGYQRGLILGPLLENNEKLIRIFQIISILKICNRYLGRIN